MASTPEGRVKQKVSQFLMSLGEDLYYEMPVPGGYGKSGLDYVCTYRGKSFYIETKRPGAKPTERQEQVIKKMRRAGAAVFVIDGDLKELKEWISNQ